MLPPKAGFSPEEPHAGPFGAGETLFLADI